jgi:hypothetical protein
MPKMDRTRLPSTLWPFGPVFVLQVKVKMMMKNIASKSNLALEEFYHTSFD